MEREHRGPLPGHRVRDGGRRRRRPCTKELRALAGFVLREDSGITVKPISVSGTRHIVRYAFEYALANGRKKVAVGHKARVMRYSDGLFPEDGRGGGTTTRRRRLGGGQERCADQPPGRDPDRFGVLLLPNLYGDILSDLCAGLVGGLGLIRAPTSAGSTRSSSPSTAALPTSRGGARRAPIATRSCPARCCRATSGRANSGGERRVGRGRGIGSRRGVRTPDLGGTSSTMEVGEAIAVAVTAWEHGPS